MGGWDIEHWDISTLEYCVVGILGHWIIERTGGWGHWDILTLGAWKIGRLENWDVGMLGSEAIGTLWHWVSLGFVFTFI